MTKNCYELVTKEKLDKKVRNTSTRDARYFIFFIDRNGKLLIYIIILLSHCFSNYKST